MKPVYQKDGVSVYRGDCLRVMPHLPQVDEVVTDPPYGVRKAGWDKCFPTKWYALARRLCRGTTFIMTGNCALPDCLRMVGPDYRDILVLWLSNGMTRGPCTFGNWIPVVVAQKKKRYLGGQNVLRVAVSTREKIDHPTPKPLDGLLKLIQAHVPEGALILDPFAGSGTTAVAATRLGRRAILIEREAKYIEVILGRLEQS